MSVFESQYPNQEPATSLNRLCNLTNVHSAKYTKFLFGHNVPAKKLFGKKKGLKNSEKCHVDTKISEVGS